MTQLVGHDDVELHISNCSLVVLILSSKSNEGDLLHYVRYKSARILAGSCHYGIVEVLLHFASTEHLLRGKVRTIKHLCAQYRWAAV